MREQPATQRAGHLSHRLEYVQRAAVAAVLIAVTVLEILRSMGFSLGLVESPWRGGAIAALFVSVVVLSAWSRNRQRSVLAAFALVATAAAGSVYSTYVLLVALLAVGLTSAGYLTALCIGFLFSARRQPKVDAAAANVAMVLGSISSMFVIAEILLWILTVIPAATSPEASGGPAVIGSAVGSALVGAAHAETPLRPSASGPATVPVRVPTRAEADAILGPGIIAAARRRADTVVMPPDWLRRDVQVPRAYRAAYWHGVLHVYNSDGFRMLGSPPPKDPDVFRVLVLGDSLTYGEGIEERFTYSRQLERLLRRNWRVEVVNAGIDGAQSEDILRVAQRLVPQVQPELVVYGVCLNDFLPSGQGQYDGSLRFPDFITARTRIGPLAELLVSNALIRLHITRDFFDDILYGIPEYRERFARDVADLSQFVRAHEMPPVIALVLDQFPELGGRGQHIASLAENALAAAGMTVLGTDEYYRRFSALSPMRGSRWEGHPNEEANAIWALMLEQVVERDVRLMAYRRADDMH